MRKKDAAGFTLLEVMVGVGVLAMLVFTMYRLVATQLMALQNSRESQLEGATNDGVVRFLSQILKEIPPRLPDVFRGIPHQVGPAPADELQWVSRAGIGLLTSAAPDNDYALTLTIQPSTATPQKQDLGIRRRLVSDADKDYEWLPLVSDVAALEFRYFHPALAAWVDRWEDSTNRPALVRMKLWRRVGDQPFEVVMDVPSSKVQ